MNELATLTGNSAVTLVRVLPGPIEQVWKYLTEPELFSAWFSQGKVADYVGGPVSFAMGAWGQVVTYEPPSVLEYTWNEKRSSCGPVQDSLVRWELISEGERVKLTLTHMRLPDVEQLAHGAGWHAFLDRLVPVLDRKEPEPIGELYQKWLEIYRERLV